MKCNWALTCRMLLPAAVLACSLSSSAIAEDNNHDIIVLSNRADLISGGDALVEVIVPPGIAQAMRNGNEKIKASIDGAPVPDGTFALRPDGRIYGLVKGLKVGKNLLTVKASKEMQIVITNHPIGGPVFAGAQLQPWICATKVAQTVTVVGNPGSTPPTATATTKVSGLNDDPVDAQCNTPPSYTYYYQPIAKQGTGCTFTLTGANPCFVAYPTPGDPSTRPADSAIADFTNDRGVTVKSLIRYERGSINRTIYQLVTFYDPLDANVAWAPPKGWNAKLLWKWGAGASASRFEQAPGANTVFDTNALSHGFMVASASLTDNGTNSNNTLAAETMMMTKERIIENYGEIRYTMGDGCSGGSIMQDSVSSAYPGLLDGIQPNCVYQDMITSWIEVADCGLLQATVAQRPPGGYYFRPGSPGLLLTDAQRTAINGNIPGFCNAWTGSFLAASDPSRANCGAGFPAALIYSATNPKGIRCDTYDHDASMVGTFVDTDGLAKANVPRDNVGIQYGLKALQAGALSPEEFVLLNEGVGGYNADLAWVPTRMKADATVLHTYYRGGLVSDGRQWARVPIINLRENNNLAGDIHANWRAWGQRDRLDRDQGSHANQVIWGYNSSGGASGAIALKSFLTMDTWLANIESDTSADPIEVKVVKNKPGGTVDLCTLGPGTTQADVDAAVPLTDPTCPVKYFASPRQAAGGPIAENIFKCQLKPLSFADPDYAGVSFSAGQQVRLQTVFPTGVCDWGRPGVAQVPVNPWTTFADGPGGQPLGPEPEAFH